MSVLDRLVHPHRAHRHNQPARLNTNRRRHRPLPPRQRQKIQRVTKISHAKFAVDPLATSTFYKIMNEPTLAKNRLHVPNVTNDSHVTII